MGVYLRAKFGVSSIILTGFRQWSNFTPPPLTSKRTPKNPTQIRVNSQIKFKASMMKSSFCDYSDAYILLKGTISVENTSAANVNANINGENSSILKLSMCNLIGYGGDYSLISGIVW